MLMGASMTAPLAMRTMAASSKNAVLSAVKADDSLGASRVSHARTSGESSASASPDTVTPAGTAATDESASWKRPLTNTSSAAVAEPYKCPVRSAPATAVCSGARSNGVVAIGRDVGEPVILVGRRRKAKRGEPGDRRLARLLERGGTGRTAVLQRLERRDVPLDLGAWRALFGQLAHTAAPCSSQP